MTSKRLFLDKKTKISWYEYYVTYVIPTIFYNIKCSVYFWIKLLQGDTSDYDIFPKKREEEKFELLYYDFWFSLEEDVLDKDFIEHLRQLSEDVKTGKVETIPFSFEELEELEELLDQ